jgi:very-short-patch-repair endonuclease/restriction endonuclease S subunit
MVWKKVKLGEVCRIEKGNIGILKAIQGDYPLVVLGEERRTHNEYQFDDEAVVIPLVSSTGHGDRSMKRIHYQSGKFSVGSILCAVMPKDKSILSAEFIYRYLDLNKENELVSRMKGMANVSLPIKSIAEVEIPIPPIDVQKEIILKFNSLETANHSLSFEFIHQLDLLKKLRQQILQDAVQGKLLKSSPPREGEYLQGEGVLTKPLQSGSEGVLTYNTISNLPTLKTFRRELRNRLTPAEATLWTLLSNRKLQGRKFRRQHSVGNYILDFFCPEEKLAVELDGKVHNNAMAEEYDTERDLFLLHTGIKVLRFENRMVFDHAESVLKVIEENFGWWNNTTPAFGHPSLKGGEPLEHETGKELLERIKAEKQKLIAEGKLKKEKTLPPIKPEEIPFEIPQDWVWCRLGEIVNSIFDGPFGSHLKTVDYTLSGVQVIRLENLGEMRFKMEKETFISNEKYQTISQHTVYEGDLIIGSFLADGVKCVVLPKLKHTAIAKADCFTIRIKHLLVANHFLMYLLSSPKMFDELSKLLRGMTRLRINTTQLKHLPIPLPPNNEQHRIVTKIEQLMKLCDELEQTIQQNQKYTQELLQVALKEALEPKN